MSFFDSNTVTIAVLFFWTLVNIISSFNKSVSEFQSFFGNLVRLGALINRVVSKSFPHCFSYHVLRLCLLGVLINLMGYGISRIFPGILYLDMIGTAAVAITGGPIYGMSVGLISNVISWKLFASQYQHVMLVFSHTNIVGGLIWGILGRTQLSSGLFEIASTKAFAKSLIAVSVFAVPIITISQFYIQFNETGGQLHFQNGFLNIFFENLGDNFFIWYVNDLLRTIPDKVLCLFFGSIMATWGMPVTSRYFLNSKREKTEFVVPCYFVYLLGWAAVVGYILLSNYNPSSDPIYEVSNNWIFWTTPGLFGIGVFLYDLLWRNLQSDTLAIYANTVCEIEDQNTTFKLSLRKSFYVVIFISYIPYLVVMAAHQDSTKIVNVFANYLVAAFLMYAIVFLVWECAIQNKTNGTSLE